MDVIIEDFSKPSGFEESILFWFKSSLSGIVNANANANAYVVGCKSGVFGESAGVTLRHLSRCCFFYWKWS